MARLAPAAMARSQISAPRRPISSLLAVTTDFFRAIAASMISEATVVPPTSSTTMSTSGWATSSRQSPVFNTGPSASGIVLVSISRSQTARTRSGNPSLSWICSAFSARMVSVPPPMFPKPTIPTFTWRIIQLG